MSIQKKYKSDKQFARGKKEVKKPYEMGHRGGGLYYGSPAEQIEQQFPMGKYYEDPSARLFMQH